MELSPPLKLWLLAWMMTKQESNFLTTLELSSSIKISITLLRGKLFARSVSEVT